jgi:hypothetical protein
MDQVNHWINAANDWVLYALIVLPILFGVEGGAVCARWRGVRDSSEADRFLSTLTAPVLGLLALMVGFTFSMTLVRFDDRRAAVVEEANAIGTAALRGQMLAEPYRSAVAPLFRDYAALRVRRRGEVLGTSAIEDVIRRSLEIQNELWRQAMGAAAANPQVVPAGLFVQSLNEMIDMHGKRLAAGRNSVPPVVFLVLEGIAIIAFAFAGYGEQWAGTRNKAALWAMGVMTGSVITLIIDLDRPQAGLITIDQQSMVDLVNALK